MTNSTPLVPPRPTLRLLPESLLLNLILARGLIHTIKAKSIKPHLTFSPALLHHIDEVECARLTSTSWRLVYSLTILSVPEVLEFAEQKVDTVTQTRDLERPDTCVRESDFVGEEDEWLAATRCAQQEIRDLVPQSTVQDRLKTGLGRVQLRKDFWLENQSTEICVRIAFLELRDGRAATERQARSDLAGGAVDEVLRRRTKAWRMIEHVRRQEPCGVSVVVEAVAIAAMVTAGGRSRVLLIGLRVGG